jgi:hypothetical protein
MNTNEQCPVCKSTNTEVTPLFAILIPKVQVRCLEPHCGAIYEKDVDTSQELP